MKKLLLAFLFIGLTIVGCNKEENPNQAEFTDEQIEQAYQEIKLSADSILLSDDPMAGFETMAEEYRKMEEVKSVEVTDKGMFIQLENDQIVGWYAPVSEESILPSINISEKQDIETWIKNSNVSGNRKTACLINTISEEEGYGYINTLVEALAFEFIKQEWNVDIKESTFVSVSFVREHLDDYDALYFVSHGTVGLEKTWIITGDKVGAYKMPLPGVSRINVLKRDIENGILATSASEHYAFCADFIREYYQKDDFKNKFVYFGACESTGKDGKLNLSLPNVFTDFGGASVYLGWHNENYSGAVSGMFFYLQLLKGNTVNEAFNFLKNYTLQDWLSWMGVHGLKWDKNKESDMLDWADLTADNTKRQTDKPVASLDYYPKSASDFRLVEPDMILSEGLLAYYPFNGNANDMSGNGNHGTVNGSSFVTARLGQGIYFENSNNSSYYDVKDYVALPPLSLTDFSLGFWVKSYKANNYDNHEASIFSIGDNNDKYFMLWCDNNNTGEMFFDYNGTRGERWNIQDDKWHFIAVVKSTETISLYIDNIMVESKPVTDYDFLNQSAYFSYHTWSYGSSSRFYGIIDEARIYNRALSDNEITALYNDSGNNNGGSWYPMNGDIDDIRIYNRALTGLDIQALYNE